jgi:transposase
MVPAQVLDRTSRGAGLQRGGYQERLDRLQLREGPARRAWRKRGAKNQAIGPSRGGQTTKIHALTDTIGRPCALVLTPGNVSDIRAAPALIAAAGLPDHLIADKGYDADALRRMLRHEGCVPVIPGRSNRKRKITLDKRRYRDRHLVENAFCRLKDYRRVATRYDKLAGNFLSAVALAALVAYWL